MLFKKYVSVATKLFATIFYLGKKNNYQIFLLLYMNYANFCPKISDNFEKTYKNRFGQSWINLEEGYICLVSNPQN
jgi:hypothetical protein